MYTGFPLSTTRPHRSQGFNHIYNGSLRPPIHRRNFNPAHKEIRTPPDDIEEATRAHVKANQEYEDVKAKYEDLKRKLEDAKRRLDEAVMRLDNAKRRRKDW